MSDVGGNSGSDSQREGAASNKEMIDEKGSTVSVIWKWFGFLKSDKSPTSKHRKDKDITNAIIHCIAKDMLPISTVEKEGFKRLINGRVEVRSLHTLLNFLLTNCSFCKF